MSESKKARRILEDFLVGQQMIDPDSNVSISTLAYEQIGNELIRLKDALDVANKALARVANQRCECTHHQHRGSYQACVSCNACEAISEIRKLIEAT